METTTTRSDKGVWCIFASVLAVCCTIAFLAALRFAAQPSVQSQTAAVVATHHTLNPRMAGVDELRHVLHSRATHPHQRKHFRGRYLHFFGVTCVMAITESSLAWARTFHAKMTADYLIVSQMALLPPDSYHVTLHNLEEMLVGVGPSDAEGLFQRYSEVQHRLEAYLGGLATIRFTVVGAPRAGLLDLKAEAATEAHLREAERHLVSSLLPIPGARNNTFESQIWHMSLSYPIVGNRSTAVAAQSRIDALAAASGGYPPLEFHRPRICSYRSMLQFDPLVQL